MRSEMIDTLVHLDEVARRAGVSPILFGTAVLELCGIGAFQASDLDVIVDTKGGRALAAAAGITLDSGGIGDRFRSSVHFHLGGAPLAIDVMADMSIFTGEGWVPYEVQHKAEISAAGRQFMTASLLDLKRFYCLARRAKDEAKIAALSAAIG